MSDSESGEDSVPGSVEEDVSDSMDQDEDEVGGSSEEAASSGQDDLAEDGEEQEYGSQDEEDDQDEVGSESGEVEEGSEVAEEEDDSGEGEEDEEMSDDEDDFQTRTKNDVQQEIEKGKAVQQQLRVWDSLLEIRIRLQQILIHANKLPQPEQFDSICAGSIPETQSTKLALSDLLDDLIELKERLVSNNPETNSTDTGKGKRPVDDDEEILSSEDEDEDSAKEAKPTPKKSSKRRAPKRRKLEEYEIDIQKRYQSLGPFRNQTIQKWNDRTQVASGKFNKKTFSAFQISTLKQIEQILSDRDRLIRRTQLKRSNYEIIAKPEAPQTEDNEPKEVESTEHEYDPEIFDDDDFYHQLLRELIERKTSSVTDPVQLSRHWLELQKFRSKMKRKVDTKASKARKIRYDVIPKLINFMAPMDECPMTDHAMNELFSSLFGQHK